MHLMLRPVADTGDEIRFAHSPGASLVMALILVAIAASAWMFGTGTVRVLVTVSAGFTAVAQLLRAVYRYELTLDLRAREWRRRREFAFAVTSAAGPLNDLDAVVTIEEVVVFAPRATGGPGLRILGFPVRRGNDACIRVRTDHATVRLGAHPRTRLRPPPWWRTSRGCSAR